MPIYHDGKKMKPYRGYRKPVNVYYGDKKVAGWKNATQTGNNLTFQTTYNDTADVIVKGKSLQKSEWVHKQGLTTQDGFAVNDEITVPYRGYNLIFRIVHINGELVTLEMKYVFGSSGTYKLIQFDGTEALYYAEEGLAAGTYNFTLLAGYDTAHGGGKTYQFTLAQDVPAGGCLMFPWGYQVQADTVKISSYASLTATTAIESVSVIEGSGGTSIGVADGTGNMNHTHRIRYGSDNYAQSAIRQWLNSSAALGFVWAPKTKFDRPPIYHTSSDPAYAGFMNGLDPDFLAIIEPTIIPCRTNGIFEVNSLDGTEFAINQTYNLTDKFFLLSRPEIFGDWDSTLYKDGELLEFYDGLTQTERIKYDAFGAVCSAWLRSPDPSNASYARDVGLDGILYSYYANYALGVAAACNVKISNLQTLIDTGTISYTHANPSPLYPQPLTSNLPAGTYKVADYKGDWYEFTLDEDLCGIGEVRDAIEFNKYSPENGFERRNYLIYVYTGDETWAYYTDNCFIEVVTRTTIPNALCTHYPFSTSRTVGGMPPGDGMILTAPANGNRILIRDMTITTAGELRAKIASMYSSGNPLTVVYQLDTPTRNALTFTKNNSSTAPECPMEFLTDTPSLEYPAEVFDASGTVKARGKNLFDFEWDYEMQNGTVEKIDNNGFLVQGNNGAGAFAWSSGWLYICGKITDGGTAEMNLPQGTPFTVSFDAKVINQGMWGNKIRIYLRTDDVLSNIEDILLDENNPRVYRAFTAPDKPFWVIVVINGNRIEIRNIQIELGSTPTAYEPYRPEVTAPIPALRSNADGTVYDEFEVRTGKLTRKIGRIESYNDEDVGDDWISSTGALDTGATVEYVLAEPIEEQHDPVTLPTYYPTTVITTTNNTPAELETTASVKVEDV